MACQDPRGLWALWKMKHASIASLAWVTLIAMEKIMIGGTAPRIAGSHFMPTENSEAAATQIAFSLLLFL